ncbi:hypothetical protein [Streptomyces xanthii]|uniref:Uncharacterized protein n=1 Tax=Streptomyces xanthii TaxID=2768069 RepID=A0A7H1B4E7_9ACTN|nr:hypothetical protein [Streptomyces xanthii]QNS03602.1 hypothetical protein IAG42_08160 [Streptomyces xanthii]
MAVFVCAECGGRLTTDVLRVALPAHAHASYGNGIQLPVLMEAGTYAVDPEPWGPPWRTWDELAPGEAARRGVFLPVPRLSDAPAGAVVIAPGDVRGTRLVPEQSDGACCGMDGRDGPNMACASCASPVATRVDDCSLWQAVWFAPDAVRRMPTDGDAADPLAWEQVVDQVQPSAPFEPIATWGGGRYGTGHYWSWSPRWEAAAGQALAHLVAASEGQPLTVPDGLTAQVFQRALDALLPDGPPRRRAVLAGPGLPVAADGADVLLVPVHPQTGEPWDPPGAAHSAYRVPLPADLWLTLVRPQPRGPVPEPVSGGLPPLVRCDYPIPPGGRGHFWVDRWMFRRTAARLPAARHPWFREVIEHRAERGRSHGLF